MFDDLQAQIKHDEEESTTPGRRRLRNFGVVVLSILLFGGLYAALRFMES